MFRFGMFVAMVGFVGGMIYVAYDHKLDAELAREAAWVAEVHAPLDYPAEETVASDDRAIEPTAEQLVIAARARRSAPRPALQTQKLTGDETRLLATTDHEAEATADRFKVVGPKGQAVAAVAFGSQWHALRQAKGQQLITAGNYRSLVFKVTPDGYSAAAEVGGPEHAARYTLRTEDGRAFAGEIVGFVGKTDVVEFRVPADSPLPTAGRINVVDPSTRLTTEGR